jgi:hypothetical protein
MRDFARPTLICLTLALGFALATIALAGQAKADVVINVNQVGGDVVFSTTGSLDLTGANPANDPNDPTYQIGFIPGGNNWYIASGSIVYLAGAGCGGLPSSGGPCGGAIAMYDLTSFEVPFGTSTNFFNSPSSSSGDAFSIWGVDGGDPVVVLPFGYISGSAILSSMVFSGTIEGFTLIPGIYNFTVPNDTIVLNIHEVAPVPLPAALPLFAGGLGVMAWWARRRKRETESRPLVT